MTVDYKLLRVKERGRKVAAFGREPATLEDLFEFVKFAINKYSKATVVGLAWDISYRDCSNTHSCPLNGDTNWGSSKKGVPTSYPGFRGRVWVRYSDNRETFGSDPFRSTVTYTGTGGAGGYDGPWEKLASVWFKRYGHGNRKNPSIYPEPNVYSWDYTIWLDDWPELANTVSQEMLAAKLSGKSFSLKSKIEWFDDAIAEADTKFITEASEYFSKQT